MMTKGVLSSNSKYLGDNEIYFNQHVKREQKMTKGLLSSNSKYLGDNEIYFN